MGTRGSNDTYPLHIHFEDYFHNNNNNNKKFKILPYNQMKDLVVEWLF